jgi:hypothetical protein
MKIPSSRQRRDWKLARATKEAELQAAPDEPEDDTDA